MEKEIEKKINQLQLLEQSMQSFLLQKQQFQNQLIEIESALEEMKETDTVYKIVGNIMVKSEKEKLEKELKEKKERTELRIKTIERQESTIKEKLNSLQSEVMDNLKDKESD